MKLSQLCRENQLTRFDTVGDGNCFFSAVAICLCEFGGNYRSEFIRAYAVAHLRRQQKEFLPFFESAQIMKAYLKNMAKDGTWAEDNIISATALAFKVKIRIYDFDRKLGMRDILVDNPESRREIILVRTAMRKNAQHYDALLHNAPCKRVTAETPYVDTHADKKRRTRRFFDEPQLATTALAHNNESRKFVHS